jgi:hypothetical protein
LRCELPHLDGLIQTTADKITPIRRERHAVDTILVTIRPLKAFDKIASGYLPYTDALVKGSSRHVLGVRRDGDSGDAVFNG